MLSKLSLDRDESISEVNRLTREIEQLQFKLGDKDNQMTNL
jgi:hypothetical protein